VNDSLQKFEDGGNPQHCQNRTKLIYSLWLAPRNWKLDPP
jgi:hypothetical protein